jgi:hypothetical protein
MGVRDWLFVYGIGWLSSLGFAFVSLRRSKAIKGDTERPSSFVLLLLSLLLGALWPVILIGVFLRGLVRRRDASVFEKQLGEKSQALNVKLRNKYQANAAAEVERLQRKAKR